MRRGHCRVGLKSRAVERSSAGRCWQTRAVDASDDPGLGTSLYTLENLEGFCRLHLHSPPSFCRPPTNILSIIVGLRPIIVVHRQIIVDRRPILSSSDKLLSASDINIVDRHPFSVDCRQFPKIFFAVYEIPDLRMINERLDTLRLAS